MLSIMIHSNFAQEINLLECEKLQETTQIE